MAMAATLLEAAHLSYDQAAIFWTANTLDTQFSAFITAASTIFEDAKPGDRPVGDWIILMRQLAAQDGFTDSPMPLALFNQIAEQLYRMCFAGFSLNGVTITNAQAVALLAAWNANIGS
jgi:hypothetical protein